MAWFLLPTSSLARLRAFHPNTNHRNFSEQLLRVEQPRQSQSMDRAWQLHQPHF